MIYFRGVADIFFGIAIITDTGHDFIAQIEFIPQSPEGQTLKRVSTNHNIRFVFFYSL